MPIVLEKTCPECGAQLRVRDGKYGEFLGCSRFPLCGYTEHGADTEKLYKPPSPYCSKCGHTGLLPFSKNGRIISNVFIDCECKSSIPEHYQSISRDDFDFPISYSFYRSLCPKYGWQDPVPTELSEPEEPKPRLVEHIVRTSDMSRQDYASLRNLEGQVKYQEKKLTEHIGYKKESKPLKSSGKGIKIE